MRYLNRLLFYCTLFLTTGMFSVNAQGITISGGAEFSLGEAQLAVVGYLNNNGTFNAASGDLLFRGSTSDDTLDNNGIPITFDKLTINKPAGDLVAMNNLWAGDTIHVISGDFDLNGKTLTLESTGYLDETDGNTVKGGHITTTRTLNSPSGQDIAGMGARITSNSNLGSTTITRGHTAQSGNGNDGIERFYDFFPTNNSGLGALLEFYYDESELNGITESSLKLFKSTDGGSTWTEEGGTVVTSDNYISLSGIDSFSRWTAAGDDAPLPVELTYFTAELQDTTVLLKWETATEVNNYGFDVERHSIPIDADTLNWTKLGFVEGNGTTNSPQSYEYTDTYIPSADSLVYRLKQIDNDGKYVYSKVVKIDLSTITSVEEEIPVEYSLSQNYPNPFNPSTNIKFGIPNPGEVNLTIYNILGEEVTTLVNENMQAGYHEVSFNASSLPSGMYIYRLNAGDEFTSTKKLLLIK